MKRHKTLILCSVVTTSAALFVAGMLMLSAPRDVEAQGGSTIPGYMEECPIYFYGNYNGQNLYLTQNCNLCGSDYVWTDYMHYIDYGCYSCGWEEDCSDPIYVPAYSFDNRQPAGEGPIREADKVVADRKDAPAGPSVTLDNGKKIELSGRMRVASHQRNYVPPRDGAPGESTSELGRLKLNGDMVRHSDDSDFVVQASFKDGSKRLFRVMELVIKTEGTADQSFVRFGQELDPSSVTDDVPVRSAKVVKSIGDHSHQIQLLDQSHRRFVVTTVKPVL